MSTNGTASTKTSRTTFVTERQATVYSLYVRHQSMSEVARMMGVSQITVRETLVQYQRNKLRDQGFSPPPLKAMLKGDVITRFGVNRRKAGGRPAMHPQVDVAARPTPMREVRSSEPTRRKVDAPTAGVTRMIITCAEAGTPTHEAFLRNVLAYANWLNAELMVVKIGDGDVDPVVIDFLWASPVDLEDQVEVATNVSVHPRATRPLGSVKGCRSAVWTVVPHAVIQLETMPRIRADGLRVQLTTGAMTLPHRSAIPGSREELGAVIVELSSDGVGHCRHILAPVDGDGSFQDLAVRVEGGSIKRGCGVEAINFGDIHHSSLDAEVAAATWGIGAKDPTAKSLVDLLRPRRQIFHDVCDFSARSPFDARNHLRRFAQFANGGGNVGAEMEQAARFLSVSSRPWCTSLVVASNHDAMFGHWLRETDFRDDPANAIFFLRCALALHERLARGEDSEGFFEATLRDLAADELQGVHFLRNGESYKVAGI
ncbi:hypothetical protein [uncultured Sphingomonas sp.]|uniref:hypothetical protein n=1 Tax=uncultured Sphingomonas sp. TaxID=158754 RepID=UPI0025F06F70|nr:hypothetical protein [uncultured Sphingomonas sp.]